MAEYLSEEEQLAQLKGWWWKYGWMLFAGAILGLGGYFGLQYLNEKEASINAAASEVFERYQENSADDAVAKPLLERLDGEFAGTAYQVMSLLARGQMATEAGDVAAAVGFYQTAADGSVVAHLTDVARLRLARSLQQQGQSDAAFAALGSVAGEGYRSLVAELKGDILRAQGKPDEAREAYTAAVEAHGENPRTLLTMKLADLSAPAGTAAVEDDASELTANDVGNDAAPQQSEDQQLEGQLEEVLQAEPVTDALTDAGDEAAAAVRRVAEDIIATESDAN